MTTVGVNISHHASVFIKNKNEYYEEDRFNKKKYWQPSKDNWDYKSFFKIKNFNSDFIFTSYGRVNTNDDDNDHYIINKLCEKYNIKNWLFKEYEHHLYHVCCGFYFSPFDEAVCIVVDAGGARYSLTNYVVPRLAYQEGDSIYFINKTNIKPLYKLYTNCKYHFYINNDDNLFKSIKLIKSGENPHEDFSKKNDTEFKFTTLPNSAMLFNILCDYLNYPNHGHDAGKVMGLSSYGKNVGSRKEDVAKQVQEFTKEQTILLIEKAISLSNCKNIILSGGYALNCVNNYAYTKHFKDLNFFIDPCSHDGGTSIGAASWYDNYYRKT
tara:strand:- start:587 stop:1561 length:975 start_codon:yes stop_codon:yes gene_type:complete